MTVLKRLLVIGCLFCAFVAVLYWSASLEMIQEL